jgi:hypothetical protein
MKNLFKIILFLLISNNAFAQSPWTREKGKAYIQIGLTSLNYKKAQINGKLTELGVNYSDITTQLYSEYGIIKNLEAQLIIPFKSVNYKSDFINQSEKLTGLGNVTMGLKYNFFNTTWKISGGIQYSLNSISKNDTQTLSTGFNASTILPYISAGSSSGKWYYFGNLGYGYMNSEYSDFLKLSAEIGYNVIEKGHLIFVLENRIIATKENAYIKDPNQWPSYSDRQSYSAVGLKLNYEFIKDKFGANFAALGAFALDNAPAAATLNFAIYAKL